MLSLAHVGRLRDFCTAGVGVGVAQVSQSYEHRARAGTEEEEGSRAGLLRVCREQAVFPAAACQVKIEIQSNYMPETQSRAVTVQSCGFHPRKGKKEGRSRNKHRKIRCSFVGRCRVEECSHDGNMMERPQPKFLDRLYCVNCY